MKCVFFGSPEFAVASLEALLRSPHQVLGVITQPDRPSGRGLKLEPPAVKKLALQHNLPILQPEKVNCEETYAFLDRLQPEILSVVAYGGFLGKRLLEWGKFPPVNVHPSLLPDLRGAAPMQWAVLRGYKTTGVTTQFMVKEMDAGDVLLQVKAEIGTDETSQQLQDRLKLVGGSLLVQTLTGLEDGDIKPQPQDGGAATFAPLLSKEQGRLRFSALGVREAHDQIRGLYPWPGAYTFYQGKRVKLLRSALSGEPVRGAPGAFWFMGDSLYLNFRDGSLLLLELQLEGKRPMLPAEFRSGIKNLPQQFDPEPETA